MDKPVLTVMFESAVMGDIKNYKKLDNGQIEFKAALQTVNEINRNTNYYSDTVLMEAVRHPRLKELIERNCLFGEISHPWDKKNFQRSVDIFPDMISHRICTVPVLEGHKLISTVRTVRPRGGDVVSWVEDEKSQLGFSMRGITPHSFTKTSPVNHTVIKSPMTILTWDIVFFPSHKDALMQTTNEGANIVVGNSVTPTREDLAEYIAQESESFRIISEQLGIEIDPEYPVTPVTKSAVVEALNIRLKDGRLAKLNVENDILCEVGKYL